MAAQLDPGAVLRPGRFDPLAVLVLWLVRKSFFPMLWLGLTTATLSGQVEEITEAGGVVAYVTGFTDVGELVIALASPAGILLLAVGLRLSVGTIALSLAAPLTGWNDPVVRTPGGERRGVIGRLADRWHLAKSYRALRWTWSVRIAAAERLGRTGRWLVSAAGALTWAGVGLFWVFVAVLASDPMVAAP